MNRIIMFLLFLWGFQATLAAQQVKTGEISGTVIEQATGTPLPFASVVIKNQQQKIIEGVITNEQGIYIIPDIPIGTYFMEVSYNGFTTYTATVELPKHQKFPVIALVQNTTQLDEVVITGETSEVSLKLDKKVFTVGKDVLSQSGSVTDVLDNVPSVTVDPGGAINLRGNANVTILINGRRSGLTSSQALEQIPSDNVARIEVITAPSSRYDASGTAGIINIILKKNTKNGFTGQVRLRGGIPQDFRISGSLNYKTDKINFFSTIGVRSTDYIGVYSRFQQTSDDNGTVTLNQRQDENRHDGGKHLYLGFDYFINPTNTFTTAFQRNQIEDTDATTFIYDYSSDTAAIVDSTLVSKGNSKENRSYNQLEMNYTKSFKKEGQKLTVDLQYDFWDSTKKWNVITEKEFPDTIDIINFRTTDSDKNNDIVIQSDYITPIGASSKLEIGAKFENRHVRDGFLAEEFKDDTYQLIDNLDNSLTYDERITGGYVQYSTTLKAFHILTGLRIEDTHIGIKDDLGNFNATNTYTNFFPSITLGYTLNEQTRLGSSYSKRINRPRLFSLNPFSTLEDFNTRFYGNPTLQPSYTDIIEISAVRKSAKLTLSPSLYYSHTTDNTFWYTSQNPSGIFETRIINLTSEDRYGAELSLSYSPLKWLSLSGDMNAYHFTTKGRINDQDLTASNMTWYTNISSRFKIPGRITLQSRFHYRGRIENAQSTVKPMAYINMGASKKMFKNRAVLLFNVTNVFDSRKYKEETRGTDFFVNQIASRNAARWSLSFVYKFNGNSEYKNRRAKRSNRN
ncbi:TonB-dependent receptor [Aquimarina sp. TRL1]|uniref:TonB-dependent receptor domain-containing protein n=1 Tax=Aquimarina sp. (strain TRL1) TaxID=2736252 RepID=UPI0015890745|nr:TonB-dependent receptor [Aquimarina sp. TRL1]QKX07126.1 TonB-dependent receptor [Aquimarina sp. TRL1]